MYIIGVCLFSAFSHSVGALQISIIIIIINQSPRYPANARQGPTHLERQFYLQVTFMMYKNNNYNLTGKQFYKMECEKAASSHF